MAEVQYTLAIDLGGTKMLAALVRGRTVVETHRMATPREGNPTIWLQRLFDAIAAWKGRYDRVGIAVTGIVDDGHWSALNRNTLDIPDRFPLTDTVTALSGAPVFAANDAQAAAWGEFVFGAGRHEDMVFLTVSTGIGGGIVVNGRLLGGLAGHFGQFRLDESGPHTLEDQVSGHWIAAEARSHHPGAAAREVFAAADAGQTWALGIVETSARRTALLCRNVQMALDPKRIVIGGSIGLAPGYIPAMEAAFGALSPRLKPSIHAAELGENAGVVGIADLAERQQQL